MKTLIILKQICIATLCCLLCSISCNKKIEEKEKKDSLLSDEQDVYVKMKNGKTLLILEAYEKVSPDFPCRTLQPSDYIRKIGKKIREGVYESIRGEALSSIPNIDKEGAKFKIQYAHDAARQCVARINLYSIRKRD